MRVNLLITEMRTGGAERCLTELAMGLQARGDRVRVMSLLPLPEKSRAELVVALRHANVELCSCQLTSRVQLPSAIRRVKQWLREDMPHVLQTFLFHANAIGAFAARKFPQLVCVAGVRVAQPHSGRILLERALSRRLQGIVCVSASVRKFVENRWKPDPSVQLDTIPNGIRIERFDEAKPIQWELHGLSGSGPVVLFLGRLHPQKGLDMLLQLAPRWMDQQPNMRLVIVGEGPLQRQVEHLARRLPTGSMVRLPWQSDVGPLYKAADVVLLPSRYEGMPNVILEAMAAGRCVMASDVEGIAELLGPQRQRQSFPPMDTDVLTKRLFALLQADDRNALGAENQQRIVRDFSTDVMVERYQNFYHDLAERNS